MPRLVPAVAVCSRPVAAFAAEGASLPSPASSPWNIPATPEPTEITSGRILVANSPTFSLSEACFVSNALSAFSTFSWASFTASNAFLYASEPLPPDAIILLRFSWALVSAAFAAATLACAASSLANAAWYSAVPSFPFFCSSLTFSCAVRSAANAVATDACAVCSFACAEASSAEPAAPAFTKAFSLALAAASAFWACSSLVDARSTPNWAFSRLV